MRRLLSLSGLCLFTSACGLAHFSQGVLGNGAIARQGWTEINRMIHATPTPSPTPLQLVTRVETVVSGLASPLLVAAAGDRTVVVEKETGWLQTVSPNGATAPLAGPFEDPRAIAFDNLGELHVADRRALYRIDPQGTVRLMLDGQLVGEPDFAGVLPLPDGSVLVSDQGQKKLWQVVPQGGVRPVTLYDTTDQAAPIPLERPGVLAGDQSGNAYLMDGRRLLKIDGQWRALVLKQDLPEARELVWDPLGLFVTRGDQVWLLREHEERLIAGSDKGLANGRGEEARFAGPLGLSRHPNGTLYVGDSGNNLIRRIIFP